MRLPKTGIMKHRCRRWAEEHSSDFSILKSIALIRVMGYGLAIGRPAFRRDDARNGCQNSAARSTIPR
jgi:hypothetical protein